MAGMCSRSVCSLLYDLRDTGRVVHNPLGVRGLCAVQVGLNFISRAARKRPSAVFMVATAFPIHLPPTQGHDASKKKKMSLPLIVAQHKEEETRPNGHEITESSSDESVIVIEPPARVGTRIIATTTASNSEAEAAAGGEEKEETMSEVLVEKTRVYVPEPADIYNTKNVADMQYLFTNDKLKNESPAIVLQSDPFCIPRVTDNVPNYRPMLNPLSIFLGEDKLLPRNFRLDPLEQPPSASGKTAKQEKRSETTGIRPPPRSSSSTLSTGEQFRGKTSAFMGTMPRQTEFAEIPVSKKLFQDHEVFRPLPPISRVPTSLLRSTRPTPMNGKSSNRLFASKSPEVEPASTLFTAERAATPASLSDAMLLSSIQHTLDVTTAPLTSTNGAMPPLDGAVEFVPSLSEGDLMCQIQHLHPLEPVADNYLPSRSSSKLDSSRLVADQPLDAIEGNNPAKVSMSYAVSAPSAFGSLLSAVEHQASSTPYAGLFIDSVAAQPTNVTMQTFSSALGSIYITTPTHAGASINAGLITPQGRSSEGTSRRPGARKPRAKNVFRPCTFPGCTKGARGKSGLCQKHGGGKRCATPNCPKGAQGSSAMCLFHGGGYRCTVKGCTTGARGTSGLCAKHGGYKKGRAGSTGEREPIVHGIGVKRIRIDDAQHPVHAE